MPNTTIIPDHRYLQEENDFLSKMYILTPLYFITYCHVNGLLKKANDNAIVTAFLAVVTVAATGAPLLRTKANTNCMPR